MRVRTSSAVLLSPWLATRSTTFFTSAGFLIARTTMFSGRPPLPIPADSVPAEIREWLVRIRTVPGRTTGSGTSTTRTSPPLNATCSTPLASSLDPPF